MSADQEVVDMGADSQEESTGLNFDNLPKKPLSAYFMFLAANRARVAAAAKGMILCCCCVFLFSTSDAIVLQFLLHHSL